jgi:hypothetical protein
MSRQENLNSLYPAPRYVGTALFGSCYWQCVANLLDWQGVPDAASSMGLTWGFSWRGGRALEGSGRWGKAVETVHRAGLEERRFDTYSNAAEYERVSLSSGIPLATAVDSFYLPSPFTGKEHITHCVIVVDMDDHGVRIVDPMNLPVPTPYVMTDWVRMRRADHAQGFRVFSTHSKRVRRAGDSALVRALLNDMQTYHLQDTAALADYLEALRAGGVTDIPDVSEVAAERLYLSFLLKRVVSSFPHLASLAESVASLERRWYMAHALARESRGGSPVPRGRHIRLISDLGARDIEQREHAITLLSALHNIEESV